MKAKLFLAVASMEIRLENGVQFFSEAGETKEDFTARVNEVVDRDYVDTLTLEEVNPESFKKFSLKQLQKMRTTKTDVELRIIQEILAERGALEEHPNSEGMIIIPGQTASDIPAPGAAVNPSEVKETKAQEKARLKAEAAAAAKATDPAPVAKEKAESKELKKQLSNEDALMLLDKALLNKGKIVTFHCTKTKALATGTVRGVRLDKRNNFIQYRIEVETPVAGAEPIKEMFGKGIDAEDLVFADPIPVVAEVKETKAQAKARLKAEAAAAAPAESTEAQA